MPTIKQRLAAERIAENHGNVSRAMLEVGYSPNTAKKPSNLTDSKGFMEAYAEFGLTPGFVTKALVEDIKGKPKRRYQELNLATEVLGMKKQQSESPPQTNITINMLDSRAQALREEYEAKLREAFIDLLPEQNDHDQAGA